MSVRIGPKKDGVFVYKDDAHNVSTMSYISAGGCGRGTVPPGRW